MVKNDAPPNRPHPALKQGFVLSTRFLVNQGTGKIVCAAPYQGESLEKTENETSHEDPYDVSRETFPRYLSLSR